MSKSKRKKELEIAKIVETMVDNQVPSGPELGDIAFDNRRSPNQNLPLPKSNQGDKIHRPGVSADDEKRDGSCSGSSRSVGAHSTNQDNASCRPSPMNTPPKLSATSPRRIEVFETSRRQDWNMANLDLEHLVSEDDLYYGVGDIDKFSDNDSLLHYGNFEGERKAKAHTGCQCFSFSGLFKRRKK